MMSCPISDVERILSAYIHQRDDALKIRRILSKYMTASLRPMNVATQNQHLNHECPQDCHVGVTYPPGLESTRKKYLDCLRARAAAQKQVEDIRTSLEQLQNRHMLEAPSEGDTQYDNEVTQIYVALLRQRRLFAELQAISNSLDKLLNARTLNESQDPKVLVKNTMGEQPDLPAERLERVAQPKDGGTLLVKAKKEVLDARLSMDRANAARVQAQTASPQSPCLQEQVFALGCARQEIVEWVQGELAKMEEDSALIEDTSPVKRLPKSDLHLLIAPSGSQIRSCYDRYTSFRSMAIVSHDSIHQISGISTAKSVTSDMIHAVDIQGHTPMKSSEATIAKFLPYLSNVFSIDTNERFLLERAVYMQTQIASVDEITTHTLLRLSGESHLLPSGTRGIESWGKTSADIEELNQNFTRAKLHGSRQGVKSIKIIVDLCSWQSRVLSSS